MNDSASIFGIPFERFRVILGALLFPVIVAVFCACSPPYPEIASPTFTNLTATSVTLGANVTAHPLVNARGIVYSKVVDDSNPSLDEGGVVVELTDDVEGLGVFTIDVTGLQPSTEYVFRAWAKDDDKEHEGYSEFVNFTTPAGLGGGETFGVDGSEIRALAVQADGKILVGGRFESIAGEYALNLARLNPDGSLDYSFNAEIDQPDYGGRVNAIAVQEDGKIVIGGYFDHINGQGSSTTNVCIARLNPDGSRDESFVATTNYGSVRCIAIQPDGSILIGGILDGVNGFPRFPFLARLFDDGTIDPSYNPGGPTVIGPNSWVQSILVQEDGKIVIGGLFSSYNGTACDRLIRLTSTGALDGTFDSNVGSAVYSLAQQPDGKILAGTYVSPHGYGLFRFDGTGALDSTFATSTGTGALSNDSPETIAVQADGKIIIAGFINQVGGSPSTGIARINANGTVDPSFNADLDGFFVGAALGHDGTIVACSHLGVFTENQKLLGFFGNDAVTSSLSAVSSVDWIRGGGAPELDHVTFEVSSNGGSTWTDLGEVDRIPGGWQIAAPSLPASGLLRARGRTTGASGGGSMGLVEEVIEFGASTGALLTVANPTSTDITQREALLGGEVTSAGSLPILERGVVVAPSSQSQLPTVGSSAAIEYPATGTSAGVFTVDVDDLETATYYTFRAYATNANGTVYSTASSFETDGAPVILLPRVVSKGQNSATLAATVGGDGATDRGVLLIANNLRSVERLGTKNSNVTKISAGAGSFGAFTVMANGLTAGTDYRFVAYAENENGTRYTSEISFTTDEAVPSAPDGESGEGSSLDSLAVEEAAPAGQVDGTYAPSVDGIVQAIAVLPEGGAIIGGEFTGINGEQRSGIAKIDDAGELDADFNPQINGIVNSLALLPDGGILVGGLFSEVNGDPRNGLAMLDATGRNAEKRDFDPGAGAAGLVYALAVQPDGKILVGGLFESFAGEPCGRLVRLKPNGSIDTTFAPGTGADDAVYSIAVQPDGKILVGGNFLNFDGTAAKRIARLEASGAIDTNFLAAIDDGAADRVTTLALPGDGSILVGGYFMQFDGVNRGHIARLSSTGVLDSAFATGDGANGKILTMAVQNDGKVIIGGLFTTYDAVACGRIARLGTTGALDASFNAGSGASDEVSAISLQEDGSVLIGGNFMTFNSVSQSRLARFGNEPAAQTLTVIDGTSLRWARSGAGPKAFPVGFELSTDSGLTWTPLGTGTLAGGTLTLVGQDLPNQGTIRVNARTAGGFLGGSAGLVGDEVSFNHGPIIAGLQTQLSAAIKKEATLAKQLKALKKKKMAPKLKAKQIAALNKKIKKAKSATAGVRAQLARYP